jgi:alpha-L-fucosidase
LIHENDVARLEQMGAYLRAAFHKNLLPLAHITADSQEEGFDILNVQTDGYEAYYQPEMGRNTAVITMEWAHEVALGNMVIKEHILCSQRVEQFVIEARIGGVFQEVYRQSVIGYKRIVPLNNLQTDCVRIRITDSRTEPTIAFIGVYEYNTFSV